MTRACSSARRTRSRYVGLTWDGRSKAHVGFDHNSKSLFETEIDHRHEAFVHFTGSGLRVGHDQKKPGAQASAETTIKNCLFEDCNRGVALLDFNDYDFTVAGCEFRDCGTGMYGGKGCNFYVRDGHFERSKASDIRTGAEHGCSVRRCTSVGSRLFIEHNCIAPLTVQDCRVSGWTSAAGAVTLNWGPVLLFDCFFNDPPSRHAPIIIGGNQRVVVSSNRSEGTDALTQQPASAQVTEIPAGKLAGCLTSVRQSFLSETAEPVGKVFDARRDFAAKGDGKADNTAAVQAAIDAARQHGQHAIAYLPSGDYVISRTLRLTGKDYRFGGSGTHTRLIWKGADDGVLVHVDDPQNVTVENLDVGSAGNQKNGTDILQTGSGSAAYEQVWVYGMYSKQPFRKGLHCRDLPRARPCALTISPATCISRTAHVRASCSIVPTKGRSWWKVATTRGATACWVSRRGWPPSICTASTFATARASSSAITTSKAPTG